MNLKTFFFVAFVGLSSFVHAQCAMCKAVVESGDQGMATGVNHGIVYQMLFPYLLVAVLAYSLYRFKFKK